MDAEVLVVGSGAGGATTVMWSTTKERRGTGQVVGERHDERLLERQHAVYHDETRLIQTSNEAAEELQQLLESDVEPDARGLPEEENRPVFSPSDVR